LKTIAELKRELATVRENVLSLKTQLDECKYDGIKDAISFKIAKDYLVLWDHVQNQVNS